MYYQYISDEQRRMGANPGQPFGTGSIFAHCGVAPSSCTCSTPRRSRLALHENRPRRSDQVGCWQARIIPTGAVYDGRAQVEAYYRESRTAFPDQRNELISLRHAEDAVIVEFWLRGTHRGPLGHVPPTGRAFEVRMSAFFIFEGERLVCERVYFDAMSLLRQLLAGVSLRRPASLLVLLRTLRGLGRNQRKMAAR